MIRVVSVVVVAVVMKEAIFRYRGPAKNLSKVIVVHLVIVLLRGLAGYHSGTPWWS